MACQTVHLANYTFEDDTTFQQVRVCRAIQQGRDYQVNFLLSGDVTSGVPHAEIRDTSIDNGGVVLATFTYEPLLFDPTVTETFPFGSTAIILSLDSTATALIPETPEIRGESLGRADKYWCWDAYFTFQGKNLVLADPSFVQVIGRYTA